MMQGAERMEHITVTKVRQIKNTAVITFPKAIRSRTNINIGDYIKWMINEDGSITLRKVE